MSYSIQSIFSSLAALCAAVTVHSLLSWLFSRPPSVIRSLQDYTFSPSGTQEPDTPIGSPAYQNPPGIHQVRCRCQWAGTLFFISNHRHFWPGAGYRGCCPWPATFILAGRASHCIFRGQ